MKMKHFSSFFSIVFLLSPLPLSAMVQEVTADIISTQEANILARYPAALFVYIGKDRSPLAEVTAEISSWDNNNNSPIYQLNQHIENGYSIARKDAVLEILAYAQLAVEEHSNQLSRDTVDHINDLLNQLTRAIKSGDLAVDKNKPSII